MHPKIIEHTGGGLSMVRLFPVVSSTKQKLNTQIYTEAKILTLDDCMPAVLCTIYWLYSQGNDVFEIIVYQDNKSAIHLENNVKAPISKRTNHINIRYHCVTDII